MHVAGKQVCEQVAAASSILAKLTLLLSAATAPWISVAEVANNECVFDVTVQATSTQCGQDMGSNVGSLIGVFVGYIAPALLSVLQGLTFTYVG